MDVVLVVLDKSYLDGALKDLNLNVANIATIIMNDGDKNFVAVDKKQIPIVPFSAIEQTIATYKDFLWLIRGSWTLGAYGMKKFLRRSGIAEENIVNFTRFISASWVGNLRYVEEHGADFFATGISYSEVGLDLNSIPYVCADKNSSRGGVKLSGTSQDLLQGYLTAKHVFEHVERGSVKFVLIGMSPYSFRYENSKAFAMCPRNLQYMLALDYEGETAHDHLLKTLTSDATKNWLASITSAQADLNFEGIKKALERNISIGAIAGWQSQLRNLIKKFFPETFERNLKILKDYIQLCQDNGAKPIGVVFPYAPAMRKNYNMELLTHFREIMHQLEESSDFAFIDLFDMKLGYDCFYDMAHLNFKGSATASSLLALKLCLKDIIPAENFRNMGVEYFERLKGVASKVEYQTFIERVGISSLPDKALRKIDVVLVLLNNAELKNVVNQLNFDSANLVAIVADNYGEKNFLVNDRSVPIEPVSKICQVVEKYKEHIWLIGGSWVNSNQTRGMKEFLMMSGVAEDNIINFVPLLTAVWLGNLRYIEECGADFFATGNEYMMDNLELKFIQSAQEGGRGGVNLACFNQDLLQGYLTAKHVFNHVERGSVKFVLIGMSPYSFRYENSKDFTLCSRNLQYMLALDYEGETTHDRLLKTLISDATRNWLTGIKSNQADLNYNYIKKVLKREISPTTILGWDNELKNLTKEFSDKTFEKNLQILKDYIALCQDNGAKPVGVIFPFAPAMRKNYDLELLTHFREIMHQLEESSDFAFIDLFDMELSYDCFYNMNRLNARGIEKTGYLLASNLCQKFPKLIRLFA